MTSTAFLPSVSGDPEILDDIRLYPKCITFWRSDSLQKIKGWFAVYIELIERIIKSLVIHCIDFIVLAPSLWMSWNHLRNVSFSVEKSSALWKASAAPHEFLLHGSVHKHHDSPHNIDHSSALKDTETFSPSFFGIKSPCIKYRNRKPAVTSKTASTENKNFFNRFPPSVSFQKHFAMDDCIVSKSPYVHPTICRAPEDILSFAPQLLRDLLTFQANRSRYS